VAILTVWLMLMGAGGLCYPRRPLATGVLFMAAIAFLLTVWAAGGPLDPADAVAAVLDIIGGLDAAQAAGILHRDIKPPNCFTDLDGTVKVGDFGLSISTLARDVRHELDTGGFQGTPQFAAPEQLRGEPLDVRADIYAVGATMCWLLRGKPPFEARDLQELVQKVTTEPPAARWSHPGIGEWSSIVGSIWSTSSSPAFAPNHCRR
jgi:serine/threonine protein kinase